MSSLSAFAETPILADPTDYAAELIVMGAGALAASLCVVVAAVGVARMIGSELKRGKE